MHHHLSEKKVRCTLSLDTLSSLVYFPTHAYTHIPPTKYSHTTRDTQHTHNIYIYVCTFFTSLSSSYISSSFYSSSCACCTLGKREESLDDNDTHNDDDVVGGRVGVGVWGKRSAIPSLKRQRPPVEEE